MAQGTHSTSSVQARSCQNCKQKFVIEPDDFDFYKKIDVPPPTWCPECRKKRRFIWRNERILYKRKCDFCKNTILAVYPEATEFPVYCHNCWWSDKWDQQAASMEYEPGVGFFEQFKELQKKTPRIALQTTNSVNSNYINFSIGTKNCYYLFGGHDYENVSYANQSTWIKDSADLSLCDHTELCFEVTQCNSSSSLFFSAHSVNCFNSAFLLDCANCQDCFLSVGLRNKQHYFLNEPLPKEEYRKKMGEYDLGSYANILRASEKFAKVELNYPRKYFRGKNAIGSTGDDLINVKNCRDCFAGREVENCAYSFYIVDGTKDSYDVTYCGMHEELTYEVASGFTTTNSKMIQRVWYSSDVEYSDDCHNSSNLFGCISLRDKHYCILNKQYTPEGYKEQVARIKESMEAKPYLDTKGRVYSYGEFFPIEICPFAYNETVAQEYFPLTKEQALQEGFRWKDKEERHYTITKKWSELPDHIRDVSDSILTEIIECRHEQTCTHQCTQAFKITREELEFYRKMHLALPRLCPNCRHYERLKQRNPLKLWHRKCQCAGAKSGNGVYQNTVAHQHGVGKCPNEFETSYSLERKEIIYCEQCYNSEVI